MSSFRNTTRAPIDLEKWTDFFLYLKISLDSVASEKGLFVRVVVFVKGL